MYHVMCCQLLGLGLGCVPAFMFEVALLCDTPSSGTSSALGWGAGCRDWLACGKSWVSEALDGKGRIS